MRANIRLFPNIPGRRAIFARKEVFQAQLKHSEPNNFVFNSFPKIFDKIRPEIDLCWENPILRLENLIMRGRFSRKNNFLLLFNLIIYMF